MNSTTTVGFDGLVKLVTRALRASKVNASNAHSVALSIATAERDGQPIVGLSYLPTYCDHAACGKVDGEAVPELETLGTAALRVDARTGFAHPALALGLPALAAAARLNGLAALAVGTSYACGSLGYFVEELAAQGLLGLMFANSSPSMAPWGGTIPCLGTNPIAFATPREAGPPLVIDQSSSIVAKVAVIDAGARFPSRVEAMLSAVQTQPGVRLPGDRRWTARRAYALGIPISNALLAQIEDRARGISV